MSIVKANGVNYSVTLDGVANDLGFMNSNEAMEDSLCGMGGLSYCIACNSEGPSLEPDAEEVTCPNCGNNTVFAFESLFIRLA